MDPVIGLALPSRSKLSLTDLSAAAVEAEAAGIGWLSLNEAGNDPLSAAGYVLAKTRHATVATGVLNMHLRHPVVVGSAASQLSDASNGRFVLGLGTGHADLVEKRLGLDMSKPVSRLTEYISVVRAVSDGRSEYHAGEFFKMREVALLVPPPQHRVDLQVAVLRETATRKLAPLADGIVLNLTPLSQTATIIAAARDAVAQAGRDPKSLKVVCFVHTAFGNDVSYEQRRTVAASLIAGMTQYDFYTRMYAEAGFAEESAVMAGALGQGDSAAASAAVSDELIDAMFVLGDLAAAVDRYRAMGVDVPVIYPHPVQVDWRECLRLAVEAGKRVVEVGAA